MADELPAPAGPCEECMQDRAVSFSDFVIAVYCGHRQAGAVYVSAVRRWAIYSPISEQEFIRTLGLRRDSPERAN